MAVGSVRAILSGPMAFTSVMKNRLPRCMSLIWAFIASVKLEELEASTTALPILSNITILNPVTLNGMFLRVGGYSMVKRLNCGVQ